MELQRSIKSLRGVALCILRGGDFVDISLWEAVLLFHLLLATRRVAGHWQKQTINDEQ